MHANGAQGKAKKIDLNRAGLWRTIEKWFAK